MRVPIWAGATLLAVALVAGCTARAEPEPFTYAFASKEAAAQAVADALAARDGEHLLALAVTEREFKLRVWPALPASRADVGMPADYLWADTFTKSRGHLGQLLEAHGGKSLAIEQVAFAGPPVDYRGFRIHPKSVLLVRDAAGAVHEQRLFGSMLESAEGWKIFSYILD